LPTSFEEDAAKCRAKRKQEWRWPGAKLRGIAIEDADAVDPAEGNMTVGASETVGTSEALEGEAR
jgi:hypothetical protein